MDIGQKMKVLFMWDWDQEMKAVGGKSSLSPSHTHTPQSASFIPLRLTESPLCQAPC